MGSALCPGLEFVCVLLFDKGNGYKEGLLLEFGVSRAYLGSELVVSFETDVTYLEEFGFSSLLHGAVLAAAHREEECEYSEIGDTGVERSRINNVGRDLAGCDPHVAKVAWCCSLLAVFFRVQLLPGFLENFD